jgi:hypothetical protein
MMVIIGFIIEPALQICKTTDGMELNHRNLLTPNHQSNASASRGKAWANIPMTWDVACPDGKEGSTLDKS